MVELAYAPLRLVRISSRLSEYSRFTSWFLSKLIYPINRKSYPTKVMKNIMQIKVFMKIFTKTKKNISSLYNSFKNITFVAF